jgi:hypothetical protein
VARCGRNRGGSESGRTAGNFGELDSFVVPHQLEESRRLVLELVIHFLDPRECLLGFGKVLFGDTSNHIGAA